VSEGRDSSDVVGARVELGSSAGGSSAHQGEPEFTEVRAAGLLRPSGCARVSRLADQLDAQQAGRRGRSVPSLAASALAVWCWLTDRVNPRPIALWLWSVAAPSRTLLAGQG